jgi:hypothetical protein
MSAIASSGRGRSALLAALSAVTLLIGYGDLWRGGTTISALCLAIAYAGLIPATLLSWGRDEWNADTPGKDERFGNAPWLVAGAVSLVLFALYVFTLGPTTAMWDTSEYITAAKVFGVPHPPGNPVFVIFAHAFGLLPLPIEYGARINLLAAVTSALSSGLWFLVVEGVLRTWIPIKWGRYMGAAAAVIIGGTAFTVWNQSVVNEKVYTVALLGLASVSWLMLRWSDAPESRAPIAICSRPHISWASATPITRPAFCRCRPSACSCSCGSRSRCCAGACCSPRSRWLWG